MLGWARDAGGGCQRFTGERICKRAGRWRIDRLQRDIPTIATYYCRVGRYHFANIIAMVTERAVSLGVRLRQPDETDALSADGSRPWVLLAYKGAEDA